MRRRLAVALIAVAGIAPWLWYYPDPPPENQPARLDAVIDVPSDQPLLGGFSGIEVTSDGTAFQMITDRGYRAEGTMERANGRLTGITISRYQALKGAENEADHQLSDSEGLAIDDTGRAYVSFEGFHRVLSYGDWEAQADWPSYTRAWRALPRNRGLEALAIAPDGTLFAVAERVDKGATETLVYRRKPKEKWQITLTMPVDRPFMPVGADFGPDGRFYVLERGLYPFGFLSRIRSMRLGENEFVEIETLLQTTLGTHGNLEGLSVWQDAEGRIRLTMVSDDNFLFFLPSQVVEYVLDQRVAKPEP